MLFKVERLLITTLLLTVLGIAACSDSNETPPGSPTPSPTPINLDAILQEAGGVMQNVDSFAFKLEHDSGGTPLDLLPGLLLQEAEGEVVKPDKISARFDGTVRGSLFIKSNLITLADASYMTNPINGRWESVPPDISPLGFFNPRQGIAAMMLQIQDVSPLNSNYRDTIRISGKLPVEALRPLFGETISDAMIDVDLTIETATLYLTRAALAGRVTESEEEGVIRVVTLSKFNEPLVIVAPSLD